MSTQVAVRELARSPVTKVVMGLQPEIEYPLGKIGIVKQILCALRDPLIRLCGAYPGFGLKLLQLAYYTGYIAANAGTALALEKMYRWHFGAERGGLLVNLWSSFWMNCRNVRAVVAMGQIAKLLHTEYLHQQFRHGQNAHSPRSLLAFLYS